MNFLTKTLSNDRDMVDTKELFDAHNFFRTDAQKFPLEDFKHEIPQRTKSFLELYHLYCCFLIWASWFPCPGSQFLHPHDLLLKRTLNFLPFSMLYANYNSCTLHSPGNKVCQDKGSLLLLEYFLFSLLFSSIHAIKYSYYYWQLGYNVCYWLDTWP